MNVSFDPPNPDPGQVVTFTITITGPNISVGGFSLFTNEGMLQVPSGENISVDDQFATHNSPVSASGGQAQFQVDWRAPDEPGGTLFVVSVIAGNDNGSSSGDYPAQTEVSFAYGCEGQEFYYDGDRDGWGNSEWGTIMDCTAPEGYAAMDGDCNENSADVRPDAEEACNNRDDNCDGEIDENVVIKPRYPDADGDGYGDATGEVVMDCISPPGYADEPGDCSDLDPEMNPAAEEVCDFLDNDCDGDIDDGAREICGEGLCIRESQSCYSECIPGRPLVESCNGWDDDCDGEVDEDEACPDGQGCFQYECVDLEVIDELREDESMQVSMGTTPIMTTMPDGATSSTNTNGSSGDAGGSDNPTGDSTPETATMGSSDSSEAQADTSSTSNAGAVDTDQAPGNGSNGATNDDGGNAKASGCATASRLSPRLPPGLATLLLAGCALGIRRRSRRWLPS